MQPIESGQFYWKFETEANAGVFQAVRCDPVACNILWHEFDLDAPALMLKARTMAAVYGWLACCCFFFAWIGPQRRPVPSDFLA